MFLGEDKEEGTDTAEDSKKNFQVTLSTIKKKNVEPTLCSELTSL
jgi:hypothetical protein